MADTEESVGSELTPMSVGSQLCTKCGLCCTGALHDMATVDPDEIETLLARGMPVTEGEHFRFVLPCPHLKGSSCGIYESRPRVCSKYRCRLLRGVEDETVELPDALAKVREARRLYEATMRLLPAGMTLPQVRAHWPRPHDAQESGSAISSPRVMLQVLALMRYIDRHFRHSDEGPLLTEEVLTMDGSRERLQKNEHDHV